MTKYKFTPDLMILMDEPIFYTKKGSAVFTSASFPMDRFCVYENVEYMGKEYKSAILCHPVFDLSNAELLKH